MERLRLPFKIGGRQLKLSRRFTVGCSVAMLLWLVLAEWYFHLDVSLGLLYILPVVLAATVLERRQILYAACACAALRGIFVTDESVLEQGLRFVMATVAYAGCGLLVAEISRTRRVVLGHYAQLRFEQRLRRRAERQLRLLAESSPAAILTVAGDGLILAANRAAHEMLELAEPASLVGQPVRDYLPVLQDALLASASIEGMRTSTSTWARRADGGAFPATSWFSVYGQGPRRNLAAIVVDTSEEVREREYSQFEHLLDYNRLLAGAVSHEIRNLCSATRVVASNLARHPGLRDDPDLAALNSLVAGLTELASFDLRKPNRQAPGELSLQEVCTELKVIIEPHWQDLDGSIALQLAADFPPVRAERHAVLQVLLNLAQNALRAVASSEQRELRLSARLEAGMAVLAVRDSGPGLADPGQLFQPFRPGADGSGLGLYISRTLMQHLDGELRHVASGPGCCFELLLPLARAMESADD